MILEAGHLKAGHQGQDLCLRRRDGDADRQRRRQQREQRRQQGLVGARPRRHAAVRHARVELVHPPPQQRNRLLRGIAQSALRLACSPMELYEALQETFAPWTCREVDSNWCRNPFMAATGVSLDFYSFLPRSPHACNACGPEGWYLAENAAGRHSRAARSLLPGACVALERRLRKGAEVAAGCRGRLLLLLLLLDLLLRLLLLRRLCPGARIL